MVPGLACWPRPAPTVLVCVAGATTGRSVPLFSSCLGPAEAGRAAAGTYLGRRLPAAEPRSVPRPRRRPRLRRSRPCQLRQPVQISVRSKVPAIALRGDAGGAAAADVIRGARQTASSRGSAERACISCCERLRRRSIFPWSSIRMITGSWRIATALPRAFVPRSVKVVSSDQEALAVLQNPRFDPRETVVMTTDPHVSRVAQGTAAIHYDSPTRALST